ncbi:MAG: Nif11-like leader peptide family natural product precursor [Eubacteriales bacterium SKADARSKE-1]|nr:Nif11-like leader peptide family natural product precursor [Eubacteriales bacterium SKADARSKE-1]
MKKGLDEFKEALIEGETFDGALNNITSLEDVFEVAQKNGYDFTMEDLETSDISDDILECVAGGKGNDVSETHIYDIKKDSKGTRVTFVEDD